MGDNLVEYELLGYPEMPQAFYIQCHACTQHFEKNPYDKEYCDNLADEFKVDHEKHFIDMEREMSTLAGSLTDATTVETSAVNTPRAADDDVQFQGSSSKKRKLKADENMGSFKRKRKDV